MENKTVYVCFIQNSFGAIREEDVILCLMVTQSQKKIDDWLDKQIAEAAENGYLPDEDVSTYKGTSDYTITVSKGNDEEGFDSYAIVCRRAIIE